jgi:hypothetical protein
MIAGVMIVRAVMMGVGVVVVVVTVVATKVVMVVETKTAVMVVDTRTDAVMMIAVVMEIGVIMVGAIVIDNPPSMLTPHVKSATFMATLLKIVGGTMVMIVVTMEIVDTRMQILPLMGLTQIGTMILALLITSLVS